ncbi:MAG: protein dehydratase [Sphingomonas hengshuiensis]|uniref:Protein dehydratase n=1 Tax=Sphingomonas hengshuiensis TaxID=1609977 RepID=A0A2W4ZIX3_9SPHN|nr:MAG: protein dehydratase [Sphingomonas hengshuiensis]
MSEPIDIEHLRTWIGREEVATDVLTPALAERFHTTLGLSGACPRAGDPAPRLIHFCLCQPAAPMDALGEDGHPARGGFLPPVPLPRRMWAGSDILFEGELRVGDTVRQLSRIADVVVKQGRSGTLCFVTVEHQVESGDAIAVRDRQTIVYRALDNGAPTTTRPTPAPLGAAVLSLVPTAPLLFRYSALTFNGHRIHYDHPYATGVEGYPGLVVHGPLQATLLLHLAIRERAGCLPRRFSFRSLSTLFGNDLMCLHAGKVAGDTMELWTTRPQGPVAMQAKAHWE